MRVAAAASTIALLMVLAALTILGDYLALIFYLDFVESMP